MDQPRSTIPQLYRRPRASYPAAAETVSSILTPGVRTTHVRAEAVDVALATSRPTRGDLKRARAGETRRERKRLLDCERSAHNDLADADRRKDDFLATLAHELRNPLSDIVSAVQVLGQRGIQDSESTEMQHVIERQSLHMARLIDDLLDVSRIASGKLVLHRERLDLVALARDAIADHQHCFDEGQVTLVSALPADPMWVVGDATRLCQVIANLLHNAAKFTDPGGRIDVSVNCRGTSAEISVRDTGIGMEPTEMAAMFEPFRQSGSHRVRSKGGLGIGLALCKRLIEKHGGAMTAVSEGLGCGSAFSFRMPMARQTTPELPPQAPESASSPKSHRILIVDDRRDARLTLTVLLKRMGQQVQEAADGATALDAVRTHHPKIVLCDIGLPDMDGYAVASAIRSDPALNDICLVALTGYGRAEDRERALSVGFDQHLTKPISQDQLMKLLLGRHTLEGELT
jgi:signal transduction histidine kinase/CheY-like chemotaxis protein